MVALIFSAVVRRETRPFARVDTSSEGLQTELLARGPDVQSGKFDVVWPRAVLVAIPTASANKLLVPRVAMMRMTMKNGTGMSCEQLLVLLGLRTGPDQQHQFKETDHRALLIYPRRPPPLVTFAGTVTVPM